MVKLALLIRSLDSGGSQRQLVELAKRLDKKRFDLTVLSFYSGGQFQRQLAENRIKHESLNKFGRWDVPAFTIRLLRRLRQIKPDILVGYLDVPHILTIFAKPFLTHTKMVWNVGVSDINLTFYDWLPRVSFRVEALLSKFADLIIVNSESGRSHHLRKGFPHRMAVIPNGFDTELFRPSSAGRAVRNQWRIAEDAKLIGVVGRLDPIKGHRFFLEAASIIAKRRDDTYFVCVGSGPEEYEQQLKRQVSDLKITDRVVWAGERADMPAVYSALDILASASLGEGLSNVIGEAMACGVPCVVTDVGDSAWLVGDSGIVVPPSDARALAAGLLAILDSNHSELGLRARSRIVEDLNAEQLAERTELELLSLLR
jgi:glycosyltransferase involved in cell wall biosynthesis